MSMQDPMRPLGLNVGFFNIMLFLVKITQAASSNKSWLFEAGSAFRLLLFAATISACNSVGRLIQFLKQ